MPITAAGALSLPDQPGRSTLDTLLRFVRDRQMLVVLDNCEHLLNACAELIVALLGGAPAPPATSREQLGMTGEATWRVPSLSVADEAVELFVDRARLAQIVRLKVWDAGCEASVATLRDAMDNNDFGAAWAEGAALSTEEAIAYAQRGRGERKRPSSSWASLTPAEWDVVRLVSEGLGDINNDIATRFFVSSRTVQCHLTHVYSKLGLTSRVQLAREAAR